MSTTTLTEKPGKPRKPGKPSELGSGRRLLRGLPWLVIRQHRIALACVLGLTVLTALWILYERHELVQLLDAKGWPEKDPGRPMDDDRGYEYITSIINGLPLILAVFVGAPLIAGDQESGTAQLVTTQSVTRRQWLIAKLGLAYTLALVSGLVVSALFTWWWKPHRSLFLSEWIDGVIFDNTGPVLPAFLLFLTAAGITIGALARRVLPAMVGAFLFTAVTTLFVWDEVRVRLGSPEMFTSPMGTELPARFHDVYEVDRWVGSADGTLYNWGRCAEATEKATDACIKEHGIVNDVIEYIGYDQMAGMQWLAAGILLAGTALLTAFTLWWTSRRPL
ncbi:ABC transporter permease [Streptomyces parvus]|uniref:ABC transporter permease n=1 Tax=Streptomyces parvus TaxID=66428 RepID=UPI0021019A74|nr:ABC transporter permease [Streptomyces parvus]MCQ1576492.1 ABC transporter permease [Streptomyces parvus]